MTNYLAFPNIPNIPNMGVDIRDVMSPGDNNENQNPHTFHRYCTPMKPHAGTDCSICMGDIENDDGTSLSCGCQANYHKECIFGWFRRSTNPTDQYARGELTCTLCRAPPTPNPAPFDYGANPDEYIEPVGGNTQVARSLFGGDGDDSDDDIQVILPSN